MVPRGNPDRQVSGGARHCFRYAIEHLDALTVADWDVIGIAAFVLTVMTLTMATIRRLTLLANKPL